MTQAVGQPAGPEPAPDRDWLERYEPLRPLGRAYWTRSLLCRDRQSGAQVVVREVRPAIWWHAAERFRALEALRREADVLARLGQVPGGAVFPSLLEAAVEGEFPWIATEYIQGATLRDRFPLGPDGRIASESGWTLPQTLHAILSLRDGLRVLHHLGAVHGLIHPGILIAEETGHSAAGDGPRLRLRSLGWAAAPKGQTAVFDRESLPYVDPYGLRSAGPPGAEADAWSVAAVLFELAAGSPPFALPESPFGHEERFAHFREAVQGPPRTLLDGMYPRVVDLLARFLSRPAGIPSEAGTGPRLVEDLFSGLAACREAAAGDSLWSQVPLPSPDLGAWKRKVRRPPSLEQIDRYKNLAQRWRLATVSIVEGFRLLTDLQGEVRWSGWKKDAEQDAALCLARDPVETAALEDATLLAREIERIEGRLAGLDRIASGGGEALKSRLRGVVEDLSDLESEELAGFRQATERLDPHGTMTPDLFLQAARLVTQGESLRGRSGTVRAERAFHEAVRAQDWIKGRAVLDSWPGGADDTCRNLAGNLGAWEEIERSASALLSAQRTPQNLKSMGDLAGGLEASAPAGFGEAARRVAGRLSGALETVRAQAGAALAEARSFCKSEDEAAARAAERSLLEKLPDREAAAAFCRELQALEREIVAAERRLQQAIPDSELLLELPLKIRALRERAAAARSAWWPGDRLPRPEREWAAFADKVNRLLEKGRGGIAAAHRLRDTQAPAGWEEWARGLQIPPVPGVDKRRWMTMAAAAGLVVAMTAIYLNYGRLRDLLGEPSRQKAAPSEPHEIPTPTPPPSMPTPTPGPRIVPPGQKVWIHGPAFATLHLDVNGQESTFALPGAVEIPPEGPASIWLTSGARTTERTQAPEGAASLQGKIDELSAQMDDAPAHLPSLDAEVKGWVEEILQRGAP